MRSCRCSDDVMGRFNIRYPIPHRLIQSILQSLRARRNRVYLSPKQLHAENVEHLPLDVLLAHVNLAFQSKQRTNRSGRYSVLTRPRLGNDPFLAHPNRQQSLPQSIVDLVRPSMVEVLALNRDVQTSVFRQPLCLSQRVWTPHILSKKIVKLFPKCRILPCSLELSIKLFEGRHQCLRHKSPPKRAKTATSVRFGFHSS